MPHPPPVDLPARARAFAVAAHGDQRYGAHPYEHHLTAVVGVLERFGITDPELVAAAWLHDVIEDTAVGRDEIAERFGTRVAGIVWALTDGEGDDRAARKRVSHARIAATPDAATVKVADRIANCEEPGRQIGMYRAEHPGLRAVVAGGAPPAMLAHLDGLLAPGLTPGGPAPPAPPM